MFLLGILSSAGAKQVSAVLVLAGGRAFVFGHCHNEFCYKHYFHGFYVLVWTRSFRGM